MVTHSRQVVGMADRILRIEEHGWWSVRRPRAG